MLNDSTEDKIKGIVTRVRHYNDETAFAVVEIETRDQGDITAKGIMPGVNVGFDVDVEGHYENSKYGFQLNVINYDGEPSSSAFELYLRSGAIKGIGDATARDIVAYFGDETHKIFQENIDRLIEVKGIGSKTLEKIKTSWKEQSENRGVFIALQQYGLTLTTCLKLIKKYGLDAPLVVKNTPYQVSDIWGFGFKKADAIALKAGFSPDSPDRLQAAIMHTMEFRMGLGDTVISRSELTKKCKKLLDDIPGKSISISEQSVDEEITVLINNGEIVSCQWSPNGDLSSASEVLCLPLLYRAEKSVKSNLARIMRNDSVHSMKLLSEYDFEEVIGPVINDNEDFKLSDEQKQAVKNVFEHKVSIITGGPGTGKSSILKFIVDIAYKHSIYVGLAAPTGKAARRMTETTEYPSTTIHRFLGSNFNGSGFEHNEDNKLDHQLIVIDEVSMLDVVLCSSLLKAVQSGAHVLFVGDVDQLESIGPGDVLADLIKSESVPTTFLTIVFRQEKGGLITLNAHKILENKPPSLDNGGKDFFFIEKNDPEDGAAEIVALISNKLVGGSDNKDYVYDQRDIQVLSPMHKFPMGVSNLNVRIQDAVNPELPMKPQISIGNRTFRLGDRVIQVRNNHGKNVFNGDVGVIVGAYPDIPIIEVEYDNGVVRYEREDFDQIQLSYALTVHKFQGSETPVVIIAMTTQMSHMLRKKLLYTAITRAKKLVVIVGSKKAVYLASKRDSEKRKTRLRQLMVGLAEVTSSTAVMMN